MTEKPTFFLLPAELGQAIADYLASRPFREVAGLMQALQQLRPVEDEKDGDDDA